MTAVELDRLELGYRAAVYLRFENAPSGLLRCVQEVTR